jgi:hypothetical protein
MDGSQHPRPALLRCAVCDWNFQQAHDPFCYVEIDECDAKGDPIDAPVCRSCREAAWLERNGYRDAAIRERGF